MNKTEIMAVATRTVNKIGFKVKKYSPEILVVTGIVGVVTSAVMACKATTKAGMILEETKDQLDMIHDCAVDEELIESGSYSAEYAKKDTAIVYAQTGLRFVKLYGPSVVLGALSIGCILASNNIQRKRIGGLTAAYAALDQGFKDYRKRVVERFGEVVDRELKYNIKSQKIEETVTDPETGKEKKIKRTVEVTDGYKIASPYARFYDDGCEGWEKDSERNLMFLRAEQNFANDRLRTRGYLFLNEVYERLGIKPTKMGQVVGWIYDPNNPDHKGDDYVDFGIYDIHNEKARDFVNGIERTILLDFNVDGVIIEKVEQHALRFR